MKLLRYVAAGGGRAGLLDGNGRIRDLGGIVDDLTRNAIADGALERVRDIDPSSLPAVEGEPEILSPVADPQKIVCIGLNYSDHAAEVGAALPSEPIIFMKAPTALTGPGGPVVKPRQSTKLDWEVELCIVIGRPASYVPEDEALDHVAGYCVGNDVSEREFQLERPAGQWTKGKSPDSFAPLGPWLVTRDEVPNPHDLHIWLKVNGETMQDGSTSKLIFGVPKIISFVSEYMTLLPGDVIMTGTPPGVGAGRKPPRFLEPGDVMTLGIEGLGEQHQRVVSWEDRPKVPGGRA